MHLPPKALCRKAPTALLPALPAWEVVQDLLSAAWPAALDEVRAQAEDVLRNGTDCYRGLPPRPQSVPDLRLTRP